MPDSLVSPGKVLSAVAETAELGVSGYGGVAIQVQGTFSATVSFEATVHGSEWVPFSVTEPDNTTRVTTTTAPGVFVGSTVGFTAVRARMSARVSGAAAVILRADVASPGGGGGGGGAGTDVNVVSFGGESIELGQATMAASLPVVIASDQSPIPITGSITANNNAAGPVGDPIPADASSTAYEGPSGNLETFKLESIDYDTVGTQAQTVIGVAIPGSGGPLPVLGGHGTAVQAMRVELPTDGTGVIATVGAVTAITNAVSVTQSTSPWIVAGGGTAGVSGTAVLTVQGIASGTAQPVSQATGTNLHTVVDSGTITTVSTVTAVTGITNALKWKAAGASGGTVLTTELNALANGAYSALGSEINNSTGLHTYGWLDVVLASLNPTTGAALTLFMCPAYDGTNYPDAPSATNPGAQFLVQTIYVATGSAAKRVGTATFRLPPFKVKFVLLNSTNVALGATSNTVTLYTSEQGF